MYGVMAAVGCVFAIIYLKVTERHFPALEADGELALIYGVIGAFVGAKLLFLLTCLPECISEIEYLFSDTELFLQKYLYGGFVFYGGLYGSLFAAWLYCLFSKTAYDPILKLLLPLLPLIHAFGRLGCFCMGCCYGKTTAAFFGVIFHSSEIAPNGIPLIPVQLIEAAVEFGLFTILAVISRHQCSGKRMLSIYLLSYGAVRFLLEFLRGDSYRGFVGPLSFSQIISCVSILCGIILLKFEHKKRE